MEDSRGFQRIVVVVDDEPILRALIADRLSSLGFEAHPVANATEAKKMVAKVDPDALIVDLDLGSGPNGIELIVALGAQNPNLGFLLLSNFEPTPWEMKSAGRMKFVPKSEILNFTDLVEALETVLVDSRASDSAVTNSKDDNPLSKKQVATLSYIASGLSNAEIAKKSLVSLSAVEQAIHRIYRKLGLERAESSSRRVIAAKIYRERYGPSRRPE